MGYVYGYTWSLSSNGTTRPPAYNSSSPAPTTTSPAVDEYVVAHLRSQDLDQYARNLSEGIRKFGPPIQPRRFGASMSFFPPPGHTLILHEDLSSASRNETDQPVRVPVHDSDWSVKSSYSTADVLRAVSAAEKPFQFLADMARDLYAVCVGHELDRGTRETLREVAMVLDAAASLDPRIAMIQTLGEAARIGADALEGIPLSGEDAASLLMASQNVMALKRGSRLNVGKVRQIAKQRAAKQGESVAIALHRALLDDNTMASSSLGENRVRDGMRSPPFSPHDSHIDLKRLENEKSALQGTHFITYMYFRSLQTAAGGA